MSEERDTVLRLPSCENEAAEIDQSQRAAEKDNAEPSDDTANTNSLINLHDAVCKLLDIDPAIVSPGDLSRGTLTHDCRRQLWLLMELFRSCGLEEPRCKIEREHLVKAIALDGPNTEGERELLYYSHVAQRLAMRSADRAYGGGQLAAEATRNFVDLATFQLRVRDRFEAVRSCEPQNSPQPSPSPQLTADERDIETDEALIVSTPALPPPEGEEG